jgi:hypothetical protein
MIAVVRITANGCYVTVKLMRLLAMSAASLMSVLPPSPFAAMFQNPHAQIDDLIVEMREMIRLTTSRNALHDELKQACYRRMHLIINHEILTRLSSNIARYSCFDCSDEAELQKHPHIRIRDCPAMDARLIVIDESSRNSHNFGCSNCMRLRFHCYPPTLNIAAVSRKRSISSLNSAL